MVALRRALAERGFLLLSAALFSVTTLAENACEDLYDALLLPGSYQGNYLCETAGSIATSDGVTIASGASATLRSPKIGFGGVFNVEKGAQLAAGSPWSKPLNPDLPGRFLFSHDWTNHAAVGDDRQDGGLLMEIASGETSRIANSHWAELFEQQGYPNARRSRALPAPGSASLFLVQSEDCDTDALEFDFCLFVQDYRGNILDFYHLPWGTNDHVRISRDQSHLAIFTDDGRLRLFQRASGQLQLVDSYGYTSTYGRPFDWLADNRLIVVAEDGRTFWFTHPLSTQPDYGLTLPGSMSGEVVEVAVSPSGQRFAFILRDDVGGNETPWIVATDGTDLRRLAASADGGGREHFGQIQWSPGGSHILVKEPYTGDLGGGGNVPLSPSLYVIPTEDSGVIYKTAEDAQLRSPEVTRLKFWCDDPEAQECVYRYNVPADVYWVQ